MNERAFISMCKKRDIRINLDVLKMLKSLELIDPLKKDYINIDLFKVAIILRLVRTKKKLNEESKYLGERIDFLNKLEKILSIENWKTEVNNEDVKYLRDQLVFFAHSIDPMRGWYVFLRTIRNTNSSKFSSIKDSVLLAHDFYIVAEQLTNRYKKEFDDKILEPEDVFDGGKWRNKECSKCGKEYKKSDFQERFCEDCKVEVMKNTKGAINCPICNHVLVKYQDGNTIIENLYKKPFKVELLYGESLITVWCNACKKHVHHIISNGWI